MGLIESTIKYTVYNMSQGACGHPPSSLKEAVLGHLNSLSGQPQMGVLLRSSGVSELPSLLTENEHVEVLCGVSAQQCLNEPGFGLMSNQGRYSLLSQVKASLAAGWQPSAFKL